MEFFVFESAAQEGLCSPYSDKFSFTNWTEKEEGGRELGGINYKPYQTFKFKHKTLQRLA